MADAIRVVVSGAAGRMGSTVVEAVEAADGMEVAAKADPELGVSLDDALEGADVMVEFSTPETVVVNAVKAIEAGVHAVVGATGFDLDELRVEGRRGRGRGQVLRRPELRNRRRPDDAVREAGGRAHARVRDRRAAPRPQARRALGHGEAHRRVDRRGRRQRPRADPLRAPARAGRPPGSDLRRRGPDALDPPRLDRPPQLHARSRPRRPQGRRDATTASSSGSRTCSTPTEDAAT